MLTSVLGIISEDVSPTRRLKFISVESEGASHEQSNKEFKKSQNIKRNIEVVSVRQLVQGRVT